MNISKKNVMNYIKTVYSKIRNIHKNVSIDFELCIIIRFNS